MPVLKLDGDASGAVRAHADLDNAVKRSQRGYDDATKAAMELERQAKRIVQENENPQERYNRKIEELSKLFTAGKVSADQQSRAIENYRQQMEQAISTQEKAAGSKYHAALDDELKKLPAISRETEKNVEMQTLAGTALDGVAEKHEGAFGAHAVGHLLKYAAGLFSIEKGIEIATEAYERYQRVQEEAGERSQQQLKGITPLVQAARTKAEFDSGFEEAMRLRQFGLSAQEGISASAAMLNERYTPHEQGFIEQSLESREISGGESADTIKNLRSYQRLYGGSIQDVERKALETSRYSGGRFTPSEVLAVALRAKKAGYEATGDQILAAIGEIGRTTVMPRQAATQATEYFEKGDEPFGFDAKRMADEAALLGTPGGNQGDYVGGLGPLRGARAYERSVGIRETGQEKKYSERDRLYKMISDARWEEAEEQGVGGLVGERIRRLFDWRTRQGVIEDEASTGTLHSHEAFTHTGNSEDRADLVAYLRESNEKMGQVAETNRRMLELEERRQQAAAIPSGRQE